MQEGLKDKWSCEDGTWRDSLCPVDVDEWWLLSGLSAAIISTVCKASRDDAYVGDTVAAGALAAIYLVRR